MKQLKNNNMKFKYCKKCARMSGFKDDKCIMCKNK